MLLEFMPTSLNLTNNAAQADRSRKFKSKSRSSTTATTVESTTNTKTTATTETTTVEATTTSSTKSSQSEPSVKKNKTCSAEIGDSNLITSPIKVAIDTTSSQQANMHRVKNLFKNLNIVKAESYQLIPFKDEVKEWDKEQHKNRTLNETTNHKEFLGQLDSTITSGGSGGGNANAGLFRGEQKLKILGWAFWDFPRRSNGPGLNIVSPRYLPCQVTFASIFQHSNMPVTCLSQRR